MDGYTSGEALVINLILFFLFLLFSGGMEDILNWAGRLFKRAKIM
jgi:hypothetical protein